MRGIFYNSRHCLCSIWESGRMCYEALKDSDKYTLDYSEDTFMHNSYDFAIFNQHYSVNAWMTEHDIKQFNKPTFCIVTEVSFNPNSIEYSPNFFDHYIVLDPTVIETDKIHAFGRPLEDFDVPKSVTDESSIPKIFSFGFANVGKEWFKIVEAVQNDYDEAEIHFNIPKGTYIPYDMHVSQITGINQHCMSIINKPGIKFKMTHDTLTKMELIELCSTKTLNCFFYNRQHLCPSGLSAVIDQALSSGTSILVTNDNTFRHLRKYVDYYPTIGIREAIAKNKEGVLRMKNDWSKTNFLKKFESIFSMYKPQ